MTTATTRITAEVERRRGGSRAKRLLYLAYRKPLGTVSLVLIITLVVVAISAPILAPYDPISQSQEVLRSPRGNHWFGTDNYGRDLMSRIIYGARISLYVGILATSMGTMVGSTIGLLSGYFGGRLDLVVQRIIDAMMAFPSLLLAMVIVGMLGVNLTNVMIAVAVGLIPGATRVTRGTVLSVKENLFIEAARCIGVSHRRMLLVYILPNVAAPIIILVTAALGSAILAEASLSFLGLGVQPPTPTWGGMLSGDSRTYMLAAPWLAIFPGLAISLAVLGWNLLGDALRDIWDPRLRGAR